MINGIDESAVRVLASSVQAEPARGQVEFSAVTEWHNCARTATKAHHHVEPSDEPASFAGTDLASNAVELVLAALGACLSVGFVCSAALREIAIQGLSFEVRGRLDPARVLGLAVAMPAGCTRIRVACRIDADAPPEVLAVLAAQVIATSPVTDTLHRPVPVEVTVNGGSVS